jgi:plastocyanin
VNLIKYCGTDYIIKMEGKRALFSIRSTQRISALVTIAAALLAFSINIMPRALAQTSPPTVSMNMTSGNTTNTNNNNNKNSSTSVTSTANAQLGNKKIFYVFSEEMEGVNETKLGIPGDVYTPSILAASEGDTVDIHFYNLDPSDRHTFTMAAPYNINKDVGPLENTTVAFKAGDPGVYRFYCTYHQPTMSGQLIIHPPPTVDKAIPTITNSIVSK